MAKYMVYLPLFCCGVVVSFYLKAPPPMLIGLMVLLISIIIAWYYSKFNYLVFFLLGLLYGVFRVDIALSTQLDVAASHTKRVGLSIEVIDIAKSYANYNQFTAKVLDTNKKYKKILVNDYQKREWDIGSIWQIQANLKPNIGRVNAVGFNNESWALVQNLDAKATVLKVRKRIKIKTGLYSAIRNAWQQFRLAGLERINQYQNLYPAGTALVSSLTLGIRYELSTENWQAFRKLGLSHLISISGLHVGIVAFFIALLVMLLIRLLAVVGLIRFLPRTPITIITASSLLGALLYALFAGFSIATQRSVLMIAVASYAIISRQYQSAWRVWWLAMVVVLLYDPKSVLSAGFWLSFILVASLLLVEYRTYPTKSKTRIWNFLRVEYAATLASIVPVGFFFLNIPVLSYLANIVAIPWFSLVITPLALLGLILPIDLLLYLVIVLSDYSMRIMTFVADYSTIIHLAQAPIILLCLAVIGTICLIFPRGMGLRFWGLIVLLAFIIYQPKQLPLGVVKITNFDVANGTAILIETRYHTLLFDTGKSYVSNEVIANIRAKGIKKLNKLVLSHHDSDHDGGWQDLYQAMPIDIILAGQPNEYGLISTPIAHCKSGMRWQWDGVAFEMLTPTKQVERSSKNNRSCVLRVSSQDKSILIMGDLAFKGEKKLVNLYGVDLAADILVLGHHGSRYSTSDVFLDLVAPQYAISSSALNNAYSHPHPEVIDKLRFRNISLYRTDRQGAVEVIFDEVITLRPVVRFKPYWQKKPFE